MVTVRILAGLATLALGCGEPEAAASAGSADREPVTLSALAPEAREATETATVPQPVPAPTLSAVGGAACALDPPRVVAELDAPPAQVRVAAVDRGGIVVLGGGQRDVELIAIDRAGTPRGPRTRLDAPGVRRIVAAEALASGEHAVVLATGNGARVLAVDGNGRTVGSALDLPMDTPIGAHVVDDRLVVVGSAVHPMAGCGFDVRVLRRSDGAFEVAGRCRGSHIASRPGCHGPFLAHRVVPYVGDAIVAAGVHTYDGSGPQMVALCDTERGRYEYHDVHAGFGSVRAVAAVGDELWFVDQAGESGLHIVTVSREGDELTRTPTFSAELPPPFDDLLEASLRVRGGRLELRRVRADQSAVAPPSTIGEITAPRRFPGDPVPQADLAFDGSRFVVAWARGAEVVVRTVRCEPAG